MIGLHIRMLVEHHAPKSLCVSCGCVVVGVVVELASGRASVRTGVGAGVGTGIGVGMGNPIREGAKVQSNPIREGQRRRKPSKRDPEKKANHQSAPGSGSGSGSVRPHKVVSVPAV